MAAWDSKANEIFLSALEITAPEERRAYLDQACGTGAALRRAVEDLLQAHQADNSREQPAGPILTAPEASPADPPLRVEGPGSRIGPYKLLQQIGEGGMGVVYMAEQEQPVRRRVALKIIKPGMDSTQVVARFEAERQALAMMDHINIAKALEAGATETGRPFFVMELVHGIPITRYCDDNHLTPRERLELFVPVCQAIQHAHQKGIIHRDVKPSNVLVTLYDGKPVPKIIDFGVAKATEQRLTEKTMFTQYGTMVGTLEYMSPEQAEMSALGVDTRSDIYSLGVLLYELLTGTTPLSRKRLREAAIDEILRLIREEEPSRPSTRLSETGERLTSIAAQRKTDPAKLSRLLRGELDWIVMKALEKDRARRYETANGFARDIQRYLADEAVDACPPSAGYRLRKFARKNRGALATAATIALLLVVGVAVSTWQAVRAIRAEQVAIEERNRACLSDQEAREERDRVVAEKKRADENLALARKAVEDYLTRVTDDPELKDRTDFTSLRKRLLESALPFYQHFALQLGDKPESRAESGRILMRLAQVQIESGSLDGAVKSLRQSRDVYTQAVADSPGTFLYRSALVNTTSRLAYWELRVHELAAARQDYAEAIRLADQLVADFPKEPESRFVRTRVFFDSHYFERDRSDEALHELRDLVNEYPGNIRYQSSLAGTLDNSASKLLQARRWQDAEAAYRESVASKRKIFESQPKDPDRRHHLANGLFNYGAFLHNRNRLSEALPLRQEAGNLLRQLVQDFPSNVRFRHMLARNQNAVGLLLAKVKSPADAVAVLREAVLLMEQLPETYPHPAVRRWRLADFTKDLAVVLDSLDRWDEASGLVDNAIRLLTAAPSLFKTQEFRGLASQSLEESLRLLIRGSERRGRTAEARKRLEQVRADLRSRNEAETLLMLALSTVREGRHQDATEDAEAVVAMRPTEANQLYDAACVFSLASGQVRSDADQVERYAKRAVELLQRSVASGFQNTEHLKKDPDLVPIHDREDYKGFIADVDKKPPPK